MPKATLDRLRILFPQASPYLMYGLTEAFRSTYLDPSEIDRRPDSIGKAIPNAEILVVRPDGSRCNPGEHGELAPCARAPCQPRAQGVSVGLARLPLRPQHENGARSLLLRHEGLGEGPAPEALLLDHVQPEVLSQLGEWAASRADGDRDG